MLISELKEILTKAESMGLQDDEVEVKFINGFTTKELNITDSRLSVSVTNKNVKPVLKIELNN